MNKFLKTITVSVVMFSVIAGAFSAPIISVAHAETTPGISFPSIGFPSIGFPSVDFPGIDFPGVNFPPINTPPVESVTRTCNITASQTTVQAGSNVTLTWNTTGFSTFTLNGQPLSGSTGSIEMTNIQNNTTYELVARTADGSSNCVARVNIVCIPPPPVDCRLEVTKVVDKSSARVNDTLTYTLTVKNIGTSNCSGSGVKIEDVLSERLTYLSQTTSSNILAGYEGTPVYTPGTRTVHFNGDVLTPGEVGTMTISARVTAPASCGDYEIPNQAKATAYELNNFNTWVYSQTVRTMIDNDCVTPNPAPLCDSFIASPNSIASGSSSTLTWNTSNATRVSIDNGIGDVAADGSRVVTPNQSTTYTLTVFGTEGRSVTCAAPITVNSVPPPVLVPKCESFSANPSSITAGNTTTLTWDTTNATRVVINNGIGDVAIDGSISVSPLTSTTYQLTVIGSNNQSVNCSVPVTVTQPATLSCQNNVSFTASDTSIRRGDNTVLTWNTNNLDSLTISRINATTLSGSTTVDPTSDTTYILTARKGSQSVDCPLTINVSSSGGGGGGGGTVTPRCELTVSDNRISAGEQITLRWDTSNATEVTLRDNFGNILSTSRNSLARDKDDFYDGSIRVRPTRDTEYSLIAERGSRDRVCTVKVDVEDIRVITQPQPLVAGIALSNVPYTGFEAGPMLTIFFYVLLAAWALFVTYLIMTRQKVGAGSSATQLLSPVMTQNEQAMRKVEEAYPHLFPAPVSTSVAPSVMTPVNLPTGTPVVGYQSLPTNAVAFTVTDEVVTTLENRAHEQRALLSSDAIRYFITTTEGTVERNEALDAVIAEAKTMYPLEDGWIVINEARMRNLCDVCVAEQLETATESLVPVVVPAGSSSLAEAIVTGNVIAAYEMIGNRPMFALADAATDLDSVVRARRGEYAAVSVLLKAETDKLSDEKLKNMITALTGALDGTYTDEASAVKMAIMKAVKEVA